MQKITIPQAIALRTHERPIVVLNSTLLGIIKPGSLRFADWTNAASAMFMSRWSVPLRGQLPFRELKVPRTMALRAFRRFLNHIQRQATSAKQWGISFGGVIQFLMPSGRISTVVVRDYTVFEDRTAKWWATRYTYKRSA